MCTYPDTHRTITKPGGRTNSGAQAAKLLLKKGAEALAVLSLEISYEATQCGNVPTAHICLQKKVIIDGRSSTTVTKFVTKMAMR